MSKKKGWKISNRHKPKGIPQSTFVKKSGILLNLCYGEWIYPHAHKGFTNFCKDEFCYIKDMNYILSELFPYVHDNWTNGGNFDHCHKVSDKTINLYKSIIVQMYHGKIDIESLILWQLGVKGSIRVICSYENGVLYPLLIDRYHIGNASEKYNQSDLKNCKFDPREIK